MRGGREEAKKKKGIIFVADHWDEYYGGIDVFNQKLCEAMAYVAEQSKVQIVCLVLGTVVNEKIRECAKRGIRIISYIISDAEKGRRDYTGVLEEIKRLEEAEYVWVGHDIKTGEEALMMARARGEKCAVIFHTNYRVMHGDRGDNIPAEEALPTSQSQLANQADWVFCVGPELTRSFKELNPVICTMIPGIEEKYKNVKNNEIVIGGRFTERNREQKNWEKAWIAVVEALNDSRLSDSNPNEFAVYIYGFDQEYKNEELKKMKGEIEERINKEGKWVIKPHIHLQKFDKSRAGYLKNLAGSRLFIMSSAMESFGLSAWEALSLEIPVVLPKNSGIYKYLAGELGYLLNGLCGSFEMDSSETQMIKNMSESIVDIIKNMEKMEKSTKLLRKEMSRNRWELAAIKMANQMGVCDVMDGAIFEDSDYAEFTYEKRKNMFDELKRRFQCGQIERKVVFFGGISQKEILDDEEFLLSMLKRMCLLEDTAAVFLCYENEGAVQQRATQLEKGDERALTRKAHSIAGLKERLVKLYGKEKGRENPDISRGLAKIHLIALKKCPSVYINIVDEDWYFTTTFENRSTQNTTVKLAKTMAGKKQKKRLIDHMRFILNGTEDAESRLLLEAMQKWEEEE